MRRTVCQQCGEAAARDSEFCLQCGAYLEWNATGADVPARLEVTPPVPTPRAERSAAAGSARPATPVTATVPTDPSRGAGPAVAAGTVPPEAAPRPAATSPREPACSRCGTARPPGRRFCVRCALEFEPSSAPPLRPARSRRRDPWWRRLFGRGRSPRERAALRAYRRSLPVRYRLIRAAGALLLVAVIAGAALTIGRNPVGWVQARWDDLHDNLERVQVADAVPDPAEPAGPVEFAPRFAVDGAEDSAWATRWTGGDAAGGCGAPRTAAGLVVTFEDVAAVRHLRVVPGLPDDDSGRRLQPRPSVLEVRSAEGHCQTLGLRDSGTEQQVDLDVPLNTSSVRIDVAAVYPAEGEETSDLVAISEVRFFQRPRH